jgi:hypothetical protein
VVDDSVRQSGEHQASADERDGSVRAGYRWKGEGEWSGGVVKVVNKHFRSEHIQRRVLLDRCIIRCIRTSNCGVFRTRTNNRRFVTIIARRKPEKRDQHS